MSDYRQGLYGLIVLQLLLACGLAWLFNDWDIARWILVFFGALVVVEHIDHYFFAPARIARAMELDALKQRIEQLERR